VSAKYELIQLIDTEKATRTDAGEKRYTISTDGFLAGGVHLEILRVAQAARFGHHPTATLLGGAGDESIRRLRRDLRPPPGHAQLPRWGVHASPELVHALMRLTRLSSAVA